MSWELSNVIHTQAEAFEALRTVAARHGRVLNIDPVDALSTRRQQEHCIEFCDALIDLLGVTYGVEGTELRSPKRCRRDVALARQIGMYVAHTGFGIAIKYVAAGFSRDRTTVMHACHVVEDLRDAADYDAMVATFERNANWAFRMWRMAA